MTKHDEINEAVATAVQPNEGDWVTGAPKWWWKYVFPTPDNFWSAVLQRVSGPEPDPWRKQVGELLQGVEMLRGAAKAGDRSIAEKLHSEAIATIKQAAGAVQKANAG
jgi:hypothetical protein